MVKNSKSFIWQNSKDNYGELEGFLRRLQKKSLCLCREIYLMPVVARSVGT